MQVATVALELGGELHHERVIDLLGGGAATGTGATDRPVRLHQLVNFSTADRAPAP